MRDKTSIYHHAPGLITAQDSLGLSALVKSVYPEMVCDFSFAPSFKGHFTVGWSAEQGRFLFSIEPHPEISHNTILTNRFFPLFDLFQSCFAHVQGSVDIVIGDIGGGAGLNFNDNQRFDMLIPDSDYFITYGYLPYRHIPMPDWSDRSNNLLWRGTSTGTRASADILDLPRIKVCRMARDIPSFDFAITGIAQMSEDEAEIVRASGVVGSPVPHETYYNYKHHLDIDGNANAWSALFYKLLSGGAVFKVASPFDYKQWFYDKLIPWHNFVPIKSDLSDLVEVVERVRAIQGLAEFIGQRGRALAMSLDYASQIEAAKTTCVRALA